MGSGRTDFHDAPLDNGSELCYYTVTFERQKEKKYIISKSYLKWRICSTADDVTLLPTI